MTDHVKLYQRYDPFEGSDNCPNDSEQAGYEIWHEGEY